MGLIQILEMADGSYPEKKSERQPHRRKKQVPTSESPPTPDPTPAEPDPPSNPTQEPTPTPPPETEEKA